MIGFIKIIGRLFTKILDLTFCGYGFMFDVLFFKMMYDLSVFYYRQYRSNCVITIRKSIDSLSSYRQRKQVYG